MHLDGIRLSCARTHDEWPVCGEGEGHCLGWAGCAVRCPERDVRGGRKIVSGDDHVTWLAAERPSVRPRPVQLRQHAYTRFAVLAAWNPHRREVAQRWSDGGDPARRVDLAKARLVARRPWEARHHWPS